MGNECSSCGNVCKKDSSDTQEILDDAKTLTNVTNQLAQE